MKYIYIGIIVILKTSFVNAISLDTLQVNTLNIDTITTKNIIYIDTLKTQNILQLDTIKSILLNDTLNVKSKILESEESFCSRNEGQLLAFFLSIILALSTIWLTNKIRDKKDAKKEEKLKKEQKRKEKIERIKREEIYCGFLHSIFHELAGHRYLLQENWKSLELIRDLTLENENFIIELKLEEFNYEFIDKCRLKILDYEKYNTDLLPNISAYINRVKQLNKTLDVTPAIRSIKNIDVPFDESLNSYFQEIKNLFDEIKAGIEAIELMIKDEIEKFTQSED